MVASLCRLEERLALPEVFEPDWAIVMRERRRRRVEAEGRPFVEPVREPLVVQNPNDWAEVMRAKRSDRSRLRRVTLAEYLQAWTVLDERERLACDLVTFCGFRESEAYGLKNGDLFQQGAV